MNLKLLQVSFAVAVALALPLRPAVIGVSTPAEPLTAGRINTLLPSAQRGPWLDYLHRSEQQMTADKAALAAERAGLADIPPLPRQGGAARAMPLHRPAGFYSSAEARHIGDIVISFQIPSGGWSKNLLMDAPRAKGQIYTTGNAAPVPQKEGDFDKPHDEAWHYMGTLDNDATNTEIHFLAELAAANPGPVGEPYRASALRGIDYLLSAQYPNGGWPQVWPLEGGYHDAITFNDNAVAEAAELLTLVAAGGRTPMPKRDESMSPGAPTDMDAPIEDYSFVPAATRARARVAVAKALACILAAQVRLPAPGGKGTTLTVWAQQVDPLTLKPVAARNYEPEALASGESADLMEYLISLPHPSAAVVRAIDAAAAWFESTKITGYTYVGGRGTPAGRKLTPAPGAGPLWSRFYSMTTGKPIFGDRDKTIHDDLMDLSLERRNGYGWFGSGPAHALAIYADRKKSHR